MRVCHVISGDLFAGAEMMCLRLLSGLAGMNGMELSAIVLNEGKLATGIRTLGISVTVLDEARTGFPRILWGVRRLLSAFRPDIVHTHRQKENILGYLASRGVDRGIRLICTQHGLDEPQVRWKWRVLSVVNRRVLSAGFDRVVAVSEEMRSALSADYGIPAEKLVAIHNGTETSNADSEPRGSRPFTIGSAGRLFPVKDYRLLIDVASEIHDVEKKIRFELAGEGPEYDSLRRKIEAAGVGDVFALRGFVEDMSGFYQGLDLYINTSLHEGFPMSILEAMSRGLPVVAPSECGIREAVEDGVHGYLVQGRDPRHYAERCLEIFRNPELRRKMGTASREKAATEFSVSTMAQKYSALYRESVG